MTQEPCRVHPTDLSTRLAKSNTVVATVLTWEYAVPGKVHAKKRTRWCMLSARNVIVEEDHALSDGIALFVVSKDASRRSRDKIGTAISGSSGPVLCFLLPHNCRQAGNTFRDPALCQSPIAHEWAASDISYPPIRSDRLCVCLPVWGDSAPAYYENARL